MGDENLILMYMGCRMAMVKKKDWALRVQMKWKAWIGWFVHLYFTLLPQRVQIPYFWYTPLTLVLHVSMHYKLFLFYTVQSATSSLARNSDCSFPLWVGVIINDDCNTIKMTWKDLLNRNGDGERAKLEQGKHRHKMFFSCFCPPHPPFYPAMSVVHWTEDGNVKVSWLCKRQFILFLLLHQDFPLVVYRTEWCFL